MNIDSDPLAGPEGQRFSGEISRLPSWIGPNMKPGPRDRPQGQFICDSTGTLLGWFTSAGIMDNGDTGSWTAEAACNTMVRALAKCGKRPETSSLPATDRPILAAEKNFLANFYAGHEAILRFTCRDLPRPGTPDKKTHWSKEYYRREWNLNYAGFSHHDMRKFLPATLAPGAKAEVPLDLMQRLAREYFIDNAHGTPPTFAAGDVKKAQMIAEVASVKNGVVEVRFRGETHTVNSHHAYHALILGRATYDSSAKRMIAFELVAAGPRRGAIYHSGRGPWGGMPEDLGPAPMGIVAVLVTDK